MSLNERIDLVVDFIGAIPQFLIEESTKSHAISTIQKMKGSNPDWSSIECLMVECRNESHSIFRNFQSTYPNDYVISASALAVDIISMGCKYLLEDSQTPKEYKVVDKKWDTRACLDTHLSRMFHYLDLDKSNVASTVNAPNAPIN